MRPTSTSPSLLSRSLFQSLEGLIRPGTSTPTRAQQPLDAFDAAATPSPMPDHDCWNPIRWTLNNRIDPTDPRIKLGMYDNLKKAGIATPLTDVNDLAKPNAEAILLAHGFKLESEKNGVKTYVLGNGSLYGNGQRAVLFPDGKSALTSFSKLPGSHVALVEAITRDADGTIHNGVSTVP